LLSLEFLFRPWLPLRLRLRLRLRPPVGGMPGRSGRASRRHISSSGGMVRSSTGMKASVGAGVAATPRKSKSSSSSSSSSFLRRRFLFFGFLSSSASASASGSAYRGLSFLLLRRGRSSRFAASLSMIAASSTYGWSGAVTAVSLASPRTDPSSVLRRRPVPEEKEEGAAAFADVADAVVGCSEAAAAASIAVVIG